MKEYVVCAENIKGKDFYSIRANTDCSAVRFRVIKSFDTYEEAEEFVEILRLPFVEVI